MPTPTPKTTILGAIALLSNPKAWMKYLLAKKSPRSRRECDVYDKGASCFCLIGALQHAAGRKHHNIYVAARRIVRTELENGTFVSPSSFNDASTTTHADVLVLLARAAKRAEADESVAA